MPRPADARRWWSRRRGCVVTAGSVSRGARRAGPPGRELAAPRGRRDAGRGVPGGRRDRRAAPVHRAGAAGRRPAPLRGRCSRGSRPVAVPLATLTSAPAPTCWSGRGCGSGEAMFTGLIREVGEVESIERTDAGARIRIAAGLGADLGLGDSVSVSGACLTVADRDERLVRRRRDEPDPLADHAGRTRARLAREPRARSSGRRSAGWPPRPGARGRRRRRRLGGATDGFARRVRVSLPAELRRYVIEHGSIALDGVSLTVAGLTDDGVEVSLIPETLERTTLGAAVRGGAGERRDGPDGPLRRAPHVKLQTRRTNDRAGRDRPPPASPPSRRPSMTSAGAGWSSSATTRTARTRAT